MSKQEARRARILDFFKWLQQQDPKSRKVKLLNAYSFNTGISMRTVKEYLDQLYSIGAITKGEALGYYNYALVLHPEVVGLPSS